MTKYVWHRALSNTARVSTEQEGLEMRQMTTSNERTIVRIWSRRVSSFRRGRDERETQNVGGCQ